MFLSNSMGLFLSLTELTEDVRSLNLSNCAAIVVYEVLRQQNYNDLIRHEVQKGENFLEDLDI